MRHSCALSRSSSPRKRRIGSRTKGASAVAPRCRCGACFAACRCRPADKTPHPPTTYSHTPDPRLGPRTLNYLPHTHTRPTHVSVPVLSISYRYRAGLQPLVQQTPLRRGLRRRLGRQLAGRERPSRRRALRSPRRQLAHPGIRPARAAQVRGRRRSAEQRQPVCGRQGVRM